MDPLVIGLKFRLKFSPYPVWIWGLMVIKVVVQRPKHPYAFENDRAQEGVGGVFFTLQSPLVTPQGTNGLILLVTLFGSLGAKRSD